MFGYIVIGLVVLALLMSCAVAWAETYECQRRANKYWKLIIAEAVGDGYDGMYAVACVVRNRLDLDMDDGLCSKNRPDLNAFVAREGKSAELTAKHICDQVFNHCSYDSTKGATHFENVEKYGLPAWAREMHATTKIGSHTFYIRRR